MGIALAVYVTATPVVENPEAEELEHSKAYLRSRWTAIGGAAAAVLGNDLREWFDSLWHGQRLAFTIAVIAVLVAGAYYVWEITAPPAAGDG